MKIWVREPATNIVYLLYNVYKKFKVSKEKACEGTNLTGTSTESLCTLW